MAFIRAGSAPHTDIEKELKRPIAAETVFHPLNEDLFPVLRKFPVHLRRLPFPRVWEIEILLMFGGCGVAVSSFSELNRRFHPALGRRGVIDLQRFVSRKRSKEKIVTTPR